MDKQKDIIHHLFVEIELDDKEKSDFDYSIEAVKKLWEAASKIDPNLNN